MLGYSAGSGVFAGVGLRSLTLISIHPETRGTHQPFQYSSYQQLVGLGPSPTTLRRGHCRSRYACQCNLKSGPQASLRLGIRVCFRASAAAWQAQRE
eukprot:1368361-Rhodomonas_salina.1